MIVTVRLFARARDLAGTDHIDLELPGASTVADLRLALALREPALCGLLERSALAVGGEFAESDRRLSADAEIALLPPVSGG
jgi:molybdopterin converting factor subunit 1